MSWKQLVAHSMNIRPYVTSDFAGLERVYARTKLLELRFEPVDFELLPLARDARRMEDILSSSIHVGERPSLVCFGAYCGNEVRALFVDPAAQGQGLGRSMLEFLLVQIGGPARLSLALSNLPARRLYESLGFVKTREFVTEYNGKPVQAMDMRQPGA